jgi:integrase
MAKSGKLTARGAATLKPGKYGDGGGLWLHVSESGNGRWVYRFQIAGKVSEAGLGSRDVVSLAEAREAASAARKLAKSGISPVAEKRKAATAIRAKPPFGEIANALIAAKESQWRNEKHRAQWRMTLETYAAPLRSRPVDEIDTADVLGVLKPLWQRAPETASRLRGRIEAVLDAAKAQGYRSGENPAAWRGHLSHLLPKRGKLTRGHHAAMPYPNVPAFVAQLREQESVSALALEFLILTATRLGEVLGARWDEIDLEAKVWTAPAERMKAAREHRIPLSSRALAILEKLSEARTGELLFPGRRVNQPLSTSTLLIFMRALGVETATIHGFRSAFRDWAGNETHFPREVCEAALAHSVGGAVEQAYRRGDALEKRRALMDAWAAYCEPATTAGNVIPLRATPA